MSDEDRAGEDREIDRLQKELLAFVVDQLTTQADSSGLVALPPKLMAAIDAHAAATLAQRMEGVVLPDAQAFSQSVLAQIGVAGGGLAERVDALDKRLAALAAVNEQQTATLQNIADQLRLPPSTGQTPTGQPVRKSPPISLVIGVVAVAALLAAIAFIGVPLAMQAFGDDGATKATAPLAPDLPDGNPASVAPPPRLEEDPVTDAPSSPAAAATPVAAAPRATPSRPAPQPAPRRTPTPATNAAAPPVAPPVEQPVTGDQGPSGP